MTYEDKASDTSTPACTLISVGLHDISMRKTVFLSEVGGGGVVA